MRERQPALLERLVDLIAWATLMMSARCSWIGAFSAASRSGNSPAILTVAAVQSSR